MPRQNIDYSKTIIYKIVCKDVNITYLYVGSTTDFIRRKSEHKNCTVKNTKKSNLYVYEFINENGGWDNWEMIEIEKYDATDKLDALKRERYRLEELYKANPEYQKEYHKEYRKVNEEKLNQKSKEYYEVNKEKIFEYQKENYQNNREAIKQRRQTKISCECGCVISKNHTSRHKKSKFHLNFLNQQIE